MKKVFNLKNFLVCMNKINNHATFEKKSCVEMTASFDGHSWDSGFQKVSYTLWTPKDGFKVLDNNIYYSNNGEIVGSDESVFFTIPENGVVIMNVHGHQSNDPYMESNDYFYDVVYVNK